MRQISLTSKAVSELNSNEETPELSQVFLAGMPTDTAATADAGRHYEGNELRLTVDRSIGRLRERISDLCTLDARLEKAGAYFVLKFSYVLKSDRIHRSAVFTFPIEESSELEQRRAIAGTIQGMEEVIVTSVWHPGSQYKA